MEERPVVNNQIQQAPVNPMPVSKKPNQWFIAVIILVAVVFIGSIFTLLLNSQKSSLTPQPSISPTSSPITDETANWKTYTNTEYRYSFKYPSGWQDAKILDLLELPDYYPLAWGAFRSPHTQLDKNKKLISGSFVFIQIFNSEISLENLESQIRSSPGFIGTERTRISGMEAIKEFGQSETRGTKYIGLTIKIDQRKGLLINCNSIPDDKLGYGICDQILSTFKFTPVSPSQVGDQNQVFCTQDVKQCSDGSYVSRQPPTCEFAPCR